MRVTLASPVLYSRMMMPDPTRNLQNVDVPVMATPVQVDAGERGVLFFVFVFLIHGSIISLLRTSCVPATLLSI